MHRHCRTYLLFLVAGFLLVPSIMWGQALRGSISGTVSDPSAAVVPNAQLTLRALATGAVTKTTTGSDGLYSYQNLMPGAYDLLVAAKGFRDYEQKGILLNVATSVRLDLKLELGTASQTVEVQANASPLNFDNPEQKGTIAPQNLEQLPLILSGHTRSAVAFARLLPGVTTGGDEDHLNFNTRVNGGINEGDEAILDGASIIDGSLGQNGIELGVTGHPFSPEAIQEITLLTANYDAQFGGASSSVLTAVTKSGTDTWHGSAYFLARNRALNARQWGVPGRPKDNESDFGATIGGPIKIPWLAWSGRKKTYAFLNYEGFRLRGSVTAPKETIPTMQERQGDFTDYKDAEGNLIPIFDPATTRVNPNYDPNATLSLANNPFLRDQFMGCGGSQPNVICSTDPRLAASPAQSWLKYLPAPNLPGILNNYTPPNPPTGSVNADSTVIDIRADHYVGDSDHVSVVIHYFGSFGNNQTIFDKRIDPNSFRQPNYDFANRLNWDHTLRPNLLNNFNLGYNDILSVIVCSDAPYANVIPGIPGARSNAFPPTIGIDGYYGFGCNGNGETTRPAYIANDHVTWVKGRHNVSIGTEWRALQDKERSDFGEPGSASFSALNTGLLGGKSGNGMASFLLGYVGTLNESILTLPSQYIRQKYLAMYASDTYKINPKLTFNYGVRWDISAPTREKYNHMSLIDPNLANPDAGGLPGALVFAGGTAGGASLGRAYPESIWYKGVAPRIGFAYSLTPKTVIRTGYGIFYQLLMYPGWNSGVSGGRDGFNSTVQFSSQNGGITPEGLLTDGFNGKNLGQLPPFYSLGFDNGKSPGLYREFAPGRPPNMQQWNLTIEHQFTNDLYVTGAYVANKGTHVISWMLPINVLDPSLLSKGTALYDQFQPGDTVKDGVSIPYAGWVEQMTNGQCSPSVAQALVPYPQFCGSLNPNNENAGNSSYESFQLKVEKRFGHGLWMMTSYTHSKYISTNADIQASSTTWGGTEFSPYQRNRNKSLDLQDVPDTLSIALVYQLPFGKGKRFLSRSGFEGAVLNKAVGGWQLTSIFRAQSAIPFSIYSSQCNIPGQFYMGCEPGLIPGSNPFAQSKGSFNPGGDQHQPLLNAAAFENGTNNGVFAFNPGQGPRVTNFRGFGFHNHDVSLEKTFSITERVKFQVRAEMFNLWNWHVFSQGTTWGQTGAFYNDLASPYFGEVTGAVTTPRNIQLGGKVTF